jgi:hypothetical protein
MLCTCISCAQSMEGIMCHITPTKPLYMYVHTHPPTHTGLRAVNGGGDVPLHGPQPPLLHRVRPGLVGWPSSLNSHTHTNTHVVQTHTHTHTHMYMHTHTLLMCTYTHTHSYTNRRRTWFHFNHKPDTHKHTHACKVWDFAPDQLSLSPPLRSRARVCALSRARVLSLSCRCSTAANAGHPECKDLGATVTAANIDGPGAWAVSLVVVVVK